MLLGPRVRRRMRDRRGLLSSKTGLDTSQVEAEWSKSVRVLKGPYCMVVACLCGFPIAQANAILWIVSASIALRGKFGCTKPCAFSTEEHCKYVLYQRGWKWSTRSSRSSSAEGRILRAEKSQYLTTRRLHVSYSLVHNSIQQRCRKKGTRCR